MKIQHLPSDEEIKYVVYECDNDCEHRIHGAIPVYGDHWQYNHNPDSPTLSPSILHRDPHSQATRCHHFLRDGKIECLADSDSKYAGTTVELKELE